MNWHGNAGKWLGNASAAGWKTSDRPHDAKVGAIIVWDDGGAGHVAIVRAVSSSTIKISEMNWPIGNGVSEKDLPIDQLNRNKYKFIGYIFPERS